MSPGVPQNKPQPVLSNNLQALKLYRFQWGDQEQ